VEDLGASVRLRVASVQDDLDPYPAGPQGAAHLSWAIRRGSSGAFAPLAGYALPWLDVPPSADPGAQVAVRVTASDRLSRQLNCDPDARECDYAPGCAGWLTWLLEYR